MDEEKLKKLTDGINEKTDSLNEAIEKQTKSIETLDKSVDEIREALKSVTDKEYAEKMQAHLDTLEGKIDALASKSGEVKTVDEQLDEMFKSETYQKAAKKEIQGFAKSFNVKTTITTANSFTQTNAPIIPHMREPGITMDPRNPFVLTQLVAKGVTNSDNMDWVERTTETDNSARVAEAGAFPEGALGWTSYTLPVEKTAEFIPVSREKLEDTDWVRGEIMEMLGYHIPNKLEYYMWNGTGSSQLHGLLGSATYNAPKTFSLPSGINAVSSPNEVNVLRAAAVQISLGSNTTNSQSSLVSGYVPNAIIVNPVDYYNMANIKDTTGRDLWGIDGVMRIDGIPVYKSTRIAAGSYVIGDFSQAKLYTRRNTEIRMWDQNSTDPIYDLVTFTASNRACFKIGHSTTGKKNYAFVTGTFVAGIAALS